MKKYRVSCSSVLNIKNEFFVNGMDEEQVAKVIDEYISEIRSDISKRGVISVPKLQYEDGKGTLVFETNDSNEPLSCIEYKTVIEEITEA